MSDQGNIAVGDRVVFKLTDWPDITGTYGTIVGRNAKTRRWIIAVDAWDEDRLYLHPEDFEVLQQAATQS